VALSTTRARLQAAVSARLVPALRSAGFDGPSTIDGRALLVEYKRRSATGTQVVSIQFEKRYRPRFVLNFHVEPTEGMKRVISQGGTVMRGTLKTKRGPYTSSWFRADRPWWQRAFLLKRDTVENEAVELCLSLLPEVELWWARPSSSAHITSWPVTYRGAAGP
jgi:hypothetical protein